MEEKFGPGVVKAGAPLTLSKNYDNKLIWTNGCDEKRALKNFIDGQEIPAAEAAAYAAIQDFNALAVKLAEDIVKALMHRKH